MSHKTKFTFTCDERGHTHQWGTDHFVEMPTNVVNQLLVKEAGVISGTLEPSQEARDDGVHTLRAVMLRFMHNGEDEASMVLIDETEAMTLAMHLAEWLRELSEEDHPDDETS